MGSLLFAESFSGLECDPVFLKALRARGIVRRLVSLPWKSAQTCQTLKPRKCGVETCLSHTIYVSCTFLRRPSLLDRRIVPLAHRNTLINCRMQSGWRIGVLQSARETYSRSRFSQSWNRGGCDVGATGTNKLTSHENSQVPAGSAIR